MHRGRIRARAPRRTSRPPWVRGHPGRRVPAPHRRHAGRRPGGIRNVRRARRTARRSADGPTRPASSAALASRIVTLCRVELRKIRHDRTELYTRAIQPALWLLIYGEVFNKIHAIPTPGHIPYLAYLAPGILAQSALFIAIFYGSRSSGNATRGC